MFNKIIDNKKLNTLFLILAISVSISLFLTAVYAIPQGPTVTILGNSSKVDTGGTKVNTSVNATISPGGYIFTTSLNSLQQDARWKGYVGNVTGTLTLDDANDNTLYQWSLTSVSGEVYATRTSGNINWTGVNCTWLYEGSRNYSVSNRSAEVTESHILNHAAQDDHINATFSLANHTAFTVGARTIGQNQCFSVNTYYKDAAQSFTDPSTANFTEVILYDAAWNVTTGNLLYETKIESNLVGYRADSTYDFQMILPENGLAGFISSTPYYFYVELT